MRIEIKLTDGKVEILTEDVDDNASAKYAFVNCYLFTDRGAVANSRDLRDLAMACNAVAEHLERRNS